MTAVPLPCATEMAPPLFFASLFVKLPLISSISTVLLPFVLVRIAPPSSFAVLPTKSPLIASIDTLSIDMAPPLYPRALLS